MVVDGAAPVVYRGLADVVVLIHAGYVLFVVFALMAVLVGSLCHWDWIQNFWFRAIHFCMIAMVVAQAWLGQACPLTTLENHLRLKAGQSTYPGDFVAHWVHEAIFVDAAPWVFTMCYSLFGLAVLVTLVLMPPRWPRWTKN